MKERERIGRENTKKQMAHRGKIERKEKYENNIQIKKKMANIQKDRRVKWDNMNHTYLLFDCFWGNIFRIFLNILEKIF